MSLISRVVFPEIFDGVAPLLAHFAIIVIIADFVFQREDQFFYVVLVYCYVGIYLFSVAYELVWIIREKRG